MVAVPNVAPVTTPVLLIGAMPGALLVHTPPGVMSLNVTVEPIHTLLLPLIAAGIGCTVAIAVMIQPVGNV